MKAPVPILDSSILFEKSKRQAKKKVTVVSFYFFSFIFVTLDSHLLFLSGDSLPQPAFTTPRANGRSLPNQVSPEERLEVAMRRFDNINPANVPAAASMPASTNTNDDNENNKDKGGSKPPTAYRRIMSPENC